MSIYLSDENGYQELVASITGWSDVGDWVDGLPDGYDSLRQLWEQGETDQIEQAIKDLEAAIEDDAPESNRVKKTLDILLESLKDINDSEIAMIGDGLVADEGIESALESARESWNKRRYP